MRPAYDLADPDGAYRYLEEVSAHARTYPPGREPHAAARLAVIADMTRWPQAAQPDIDEALAALTLLGSLRDWLAEAEPRLIEAARAQGATWQSLAGVLRVGDRRAAQRRASRLARATRLACLPRDSRPLPDVARYDELLASRRRPQPPAGAAAVTAVGLRRGEASPLAGDET